MAFPSDRLFAVSNRWMVIDGGLSFCSTKWKPKSTLSHYVISLNLKSGRFFDRILEQRQGIDIGSECGGISIRFLGSLVGVLKGFFRLFDVCSTFGHPASGLLDFVLSKSADKIEALLSNPKQTTVFITKTVHCKNVFQRALLYTLS